MYNDTDTVSRLPRKRQRILSSNQSKFGCFTCKSRRIKCDESKPVCLRCIRSNRKCDGYPANAPNANHLVRTNSNQLSVSPPTFIARSISTGSHLITLGCSVFIADRSSRYDGPGTTFTSTILPDLCYSYPLVASACTLFGASYEARILRKPLYTSAIANTYAKVLKDLQQDIEIQRDGILPLLVACSLVAAADTILRRHEQALLHLEGALAMFQLHGMEKQPAEIRAFLQSLDLLASTLALQRPLTLPVVSSDDIDLCFTNMEQAEIAVTNLLQMCYNFTASAGYSKYMPRKEIPLQVELDQDDLISKLTLCLQSLELVAPTEITDNFLSSINHVNGHASLLKAQCLATLIYVSTILRPHEMAYDEHKLQFQHVVDNVEIALHNMNTVTRSSIHSLPRFSPSPGLNSSLCLTAHKCRDGLIRRKAISLMLQAGIEGPWDGAVEAILASRMVEIEEYGLGRIEDLDSPSGNPSSVIPEKARISGVSILHETSECNSLGLRTAVVQFSQCVDVEAMMTGRPPFSHAVHWRYWKEEIFVP